MASPPIQATTTKHLCALVEQAIAALGPHCDLNHIDVSRIQSFDGVFAHSAFDGDIARWDVSNGVSFSNTFAHCPFNGNLAHWNMRNALTTSGMFLHSAFQGDIANWDVSGVTCMEEMFQGSRFEGDLSGWDVSHVIQMNNMFKNTPFSGDVSSWNTANLREARGMFDGSAFHGDVSKWNVSKLSDARSMFNTPSFHGDLSSWALRSRVQHQEMVHPTFCGVLPRVEHYDPIDAGAKMLGGVGALNAYALRAHFNAAHAHMLLWAPERCSWASQDDVRWAREVAEMGRAVGMKSDALVQLMVEQKMIILEPSRYSFDFSTLS